MLLSSHQEPQKLTFMADSLGPFSQGSLYRSYHAGGSTHELIPNL